MKYIIVDLEATCWENKNEPKQNEIIEIGAVCINENKEIESEFCAFVKPILHPTLSDFCKKLTTIKQSDVDIALHFDKVVVAFKNWIGTEEYVLCSWGFYDKTQLTSDCKLHQLNTSWLNKHISIKHQHAFLKNLTKPMGMAGALSLEGLKLTGIHHRGIDDARNIAKVFLKYFEKWQLNEK
jgi:3'-5' exoribonuclease 1